MNGCQDSPKSEFVQNANPLIGTEKRCSKCGQVKPVDEFHRDKRTPHGRLYKCKMCVNSYNREWGRANRARKTANTQKWRKQNPDKIKSYVPMRKKWNEKNYTKMRVAANKANRKIRTTPKGHLNHNVANLIRLSLRGSKAGWHWESLVGGTLRNNFFLACLGKTWESGT
jgi:hypothetical protein